MDSMDSFLQIKQYAKIPKTLEFRLNALKKLQSYIINHQDLIQQALFKDLHKSPAESYITEISQVLEELRFHIKHLASLLRPKRVKTPLTHFLAKSFIYPQSYGAVLIISPWNYPFALSIIPLIGAISGGNCAIIKPSEYATHTSTLLHSMIEVIFEALFVSVKLGDKEASLALLEKPFDYIFFTGSPNVGKIVMSKAAKNLTPLTLELGGKNPCIITQSADIKLSAKRIAWGKFLNAGQTCIAPDYLLLHESIKEAFLQEFIQCIESFFMQDKSEDCRDSKKVDSKDFDNSNQTATQAHIGQIQQSQDFGRIISTRHFERIVNLLEHSKRDSLLIYGGGFDSADNFIMPSIFDLGSIEKDFAHIKAKSLMQEEIFAPLVPIITFQNLSDVAVLIESLPKPLAAYLFTQDSKNEQFFVEQISFGGGCINDCIMHIANNHLPFGGIGQSGMGSYHGKQSFYTFTHQKSILKTSTLFDMPFRYAPFDKLICGIKQIKWLKFLIG